MWEGKARVHTYYIVSQLKVSGLSLYLISKLNLNCDESEITEPHGDACERTQKTYPEIERFWKGQPSSGSNNPCCRPATTLKKTHFLRSAVHRIFPSIFFFEETYLSFYWTHLHGSAKSQIPCHDWTSNSTNFSHKSLRFRHVKCSRGPGEIIYLGLHCLGYLTRWNVSQARQFRDG